MVLPNDIKKWMEINAEHSSYSDAALMYIKALILDADSVATEGVIVWNKRNC